MAKHFIIYETKNLKNGKIYIGMHETDNLNDGYLGSGKHLKSDTFTTLGVVVSLVLVQLTKLYWIDAVVALLFGGYIMIIGYKIIRKSLSGIMDEADLGMLQKLSKFRRFSFLKENES